MSSGAFKSDGTPRQLGKLVRMRALSPSELPQHAELGAQQRADIAPPLPQFAAAVLAEAENFMTTYVPAKFKTKDTSKSSPPSKASVELLSCEINGSEIPSVLPTVAAGRTAETWFARTSVHENAAEQGTASWAEFDQGLRAEHSQHEKEYTPDVMDAHEVLSWDRELEESEQGRSVEGWEDVSVSVMEMVHHIPPPLSDRVFPVAVVTARREGMFLVVQIPVDTTAMPRAKYSGKGAKVTTGMYCSIERGELLESGAKVRWQMATASDAKGNLPMFMQKMGVPGAVVKDVGLFIGWCGQRRLGTA